MPTPALGRHVLYVPRKLTGADEQRAAIITKVWNDTTVNLAIFDEQGLLYTPPPTGIHLLQEGETPAPTGGYCMWPPFIAVNAPVATEPLAPVVGIAEDLNKISNLLANNNKNEAPS